MKLASLFVAAILLAAPACTKAPARPAQIPPPQAQPRVAVIDIQKAVTSTRDGKRAEAELLREFAPLQKQFAQDQSEIEALKQQILNRPFEETKPIQEKINTLMQAYNRRAQDAQQKVEVERKLVLKDLTARLVVVAGDFAKQNHFDTVLDTANVLWHADQTDITDQVIALYDQMSLKTQISGRFR
jgi:outer membrane protein